MGIDTQALKDKITRDINEHQSAISRLEEDLEAVEKVENLAKELDVVDNQPEPPSNGQPYKKMQQQDACLDVLNHADKPMTAEAVAEVLKTGGYPFAANDKKNRLQSALKVMVKDGQIRANGKGASAEFHV